MPVVAGQRCGRCVAGWKSTCSELRNALANKTLVLGVASVRGDAVINGIHQQIYRAVAIRDTGRKQAKNYSFVWLIAERLLIRFTYTKHILSNVLANPCPQINHAESFAALIAVFRLRAAPMLVH